jgi:uncharacterized protein (DUF3820 family)
MVKNISSELQSLLDMALDICQAAAKGAECEEFETDFSFQAFASMVMAEWCRRTGSEEAIIEFRREKRLTLLHRGITAGYAVILDEGDNPGPNRIVPMEDDEAREFSEEPMPFGRFKGRRIHDVPMDHLVWLDRQRRDWWLRLEGYLRSHVIRIELDNLGDHRRGQHLSLDNEF